MMQSDEVYMKRCIEIAGAGRAYASPNPLVGAVIVNDGKIIGEGFHAVCGEAHAEVNAINSVRDKELLSKSTLYVNLEPCCHHGKTSPCTELILKYRIPEIVIGCVDSNPKVKGMGIKCLRENGCKVRINVLEKECYYLNRRFFTFQEKHRPFILLKWAQSLDGFMDVERKDSKIDSCWISNNALNLKVHTWRAEESGILVGANTVFNDNPRLNVRYCSGRQPIRIVYMDKIPCDFKKYHIFDHTQTSIIFNTEADREEENLHFVKVSSFDFKIILQKLYEMQIISVLVEGGRKTLDRFISENIWDEARILIGNQCFGRGLSAPHLSILPNNMEDVEDNKVLYYVNN